MARRALLRTSPATVRKQGAASLLLGIATVLGCHKPADEEKKTTPKVVVRVAKAERRTLHPTLEVIGLVQAAPERQALLSTAAPGLVESLGAAEGAHVKKGDLIVKLDERKARLDLERAEAALARLIAKPRREELSQAAGLLEKAKSAHDLAERRLKKSENLRRQSPELVPEIQLLDDRRAEEAARADLESAEAQQELLNKGPRDEQRREAALDVDAARLQLDFCRVTAPFEGDLIELLARAGMKADVGTPLARLLDPSEVVVQARVPGDHLAAVAASVRNFKGEAAAVVRSESFPGESFAANSVWLSQQTEATTSDVAVKFRVPNLKGLLRVGMAVAVTIHAPAVEGVAVPEAAIYVNEEGHRVVTVVKENKAYPTEIEVSSETERDVRADGWVRVLKGVNAGDEVAVENGYALPKETEVELGPPGTEKKEPPEGKKDDPGGGNEKGAAEGKKDAAAHE